MLELKKINKTYQTGDFHQQALNDISIAFKTNEFVAILGHSGSGKTTLLNIIGGLDRYDDGDLIINNKSTKNFKDRDWDAYRNNCIGFVFQSYNLIGHISVLANVEMGMTLSGVSGGKRRRRAIEALERVGLKSHVHKKPNQLSGGEQQRVCIARALVNDPDIILADEPTGALDSKTSVQILELIKEISKDKLVIMVTHNAELASTYAKRIIRLKDGQMESDTDQVHTNTVDTDKFNIRRTAMNFLTALNLSFNNIRTKLGRTLLTAFASSIGIIGIALILSLSNGFDIKINEFERDSLSSFPIMISKTAMQMDEETMAQLHEHNNDEQKKYPSALELYPEEPQREQITHTNILDKEYIDYINKIDNDLISGLSFQSPTNLNLITQNKDGDYVPASGRVFGAIPEKKTDSKFEFMENTFDLLYGSYPTSKEEMVLIVDSKNYVSTDILDALGLDSTKDAISFADIVGKEFKWIKNDDYYVSLGKIYTLNTDLESLYNKSSLSLKIVGIIRGKKEKEMLTSFTNGVGYRQELIDYVIEVNSSSLIVKSQEEVDYNILTAKIFDANNTQEESKEQVLAYLGAQFSPYIIYVYSKDFNTKDKVVEYLDAFNEGKEKDDKVVYTDMGKIISNLSNNIMNGITIVLIAFSAISLVVSSIMIAIITYISVLERTKEIGILRALGARKKDITRVFNAETFIIGLTSGIIGIGIARLLLFPANRIIYNLTQLKGVAVLNPVHALMLMLISLALTLLGGAIPAILASKKDPVVALRTE